MRTNPRSWFWVEAGLAALSGCLFVVTVVWRDWVELIFKVEPDNGNGSLEWTIVLSLAVMTVVLGLLARREWHRCAIA